jgi:sec-independent protein translocase protein TatB
MLSIPHLIIIFVVALVVFGPEKLPDLARNIGKVMGEFRRATGDLRTTFEGHLRDLERETEQRRIGPETGSVEPIQPPPDAFVTAAGTVPATPPHELATSAAEDEFPAPVLPVSNDVPTTSASSELSPTKAAPDHSVEPVSDGSNRPA